MTVTPAGIAWPHGHRSAVSLAFDLDGPTGSAMLDGSLWRAPRRFAEGGYDPFRALPRVLDILRDHAIPATFYTPAWVVERWPEATARIVEDGHEIAHHGYRHERFADLTVEQQLDVISRSQEIFQRYLGRTAVGYRTPTGDWHEATPGLLVQSGFRYSSSLRDHHLPYHHVIDGVTTELVEIPARVDLDDYAYFAYSRDPGFPRGGDRIAGYRTWLANVKREIDGHHEVGGCLTTTFHPKISATPGRARLIRELAAYLTGIDGLWLARAADIAQHVNRHVDRHVTRQRAEAS